MEYSATDTINAAPMTLWAILTDADRFPEWEPHVTRIEGRIAQGEQITIHTTLSARAFPATVTEFLPGERMVWAGGMPLNLFRGVRTFTLEPLADGTTRVTTREVFSGMLLPLVGRTMPDLQPSFDAFIAALKHRAEGEP